MQHGVLCVIGVLAGDLLGEGKGEAENSRHECAKLLEAALIGRKKKIRHSVTACRIAYIQTTHLTICSVMVVNHLARKNRVAQSSGV